MPTIRQKKLAQVIVENMNNETSLTAGQMLEKVGYAKNVAEAKPGEIINSKGVQEELVILGFTEDKAKSVVAEILENKEAEPNARLKAADMIFKVKGSYAPEKSQHVELHLGSEELIKMAELLKSNDRERLFGPGEQSNGTRPDAMDKEVSDKE